MLNRNKNIAPIKSTEKAVISCLYGNGWTEIIHGTYCKERERIDSLQVSATIRPPKVIGFDNFELNVIISRYEKEKTKTSFHFKLNGKQIYRLEQDKNKDWHLQETLNKSDHIEMPLRNWQQAIGLIINFEDNLPDFVKTVGVAKCIELSRNLDTK